MMRWQGLVLALWGGTKQVGRYEVGTVGSSYSRWLGRSTHLAPTEEGLFVAHPHQGGKKKKKETCQHTKTGPLACVSHSHQTRPSHISRRCWQKQ